MIKRGTFGARHLVAVAALVIAALGAGVAPSDAADAVIKVSNHALHDGRISPMLFGNFIELLEDLVPGMWAEMLNNRGFEGIVPAANWVYYDGSPTFCDRDWDASRDWTAARDDAPFTGRRCVRITVKGDRPARLSQSGLSVKRGVSYRVSGWFRGEGAARVRALLVAEAPDGGPQELAAAGPWAPTDQYTRFSADLRPVASSDRAALVLLVSGEGVVRLDQLSLMPEDNLRGWRADVVETIKAARPALVRWGGSAVDPGAYRWKQGIGERDRRQPFRNVNWGRIDSNDVGIDEFRDFCTLVGAEPLVCLSFSDGPESAADLVQYCNGGPETEWGARRAANGHRAPYRIQYWQLGNEIRGDDAAYVARCRSFIAAMKAVDLNIKVLSSFPAQQVLNGLGKDLAYLAPHHYTRDLGACEADFQKLAGMIATTPGCGHLRLAVTEWNLTAGDWGLGRGHMLTLEGALHNARYLNLLCRNAHLVEIACRSNMTNSFCSGIIETRPGKVLRRPSYHVMKLYAEHALPRPLAIDEAPDGVDVVACASDDGRRACVFVVNPRREPLAVSLDLAELGKDFVPLRGECVRDTLDRRQPDVMNHWNRPDRVSTSRLSLEKGKFRLPAYSVAAIECGKP